MQAAGVYQQFKHEVQADVLAGIQRLGGTVQYYNMGELRDRLCPEYPVVWVKRAVGSLVFRQRRVVRRHPGRQDFYDPSPVTITVAH